MSKLKTIYIRVHDLEQNFICWKHPTDSGLPKVWLDKRLPQLSDAVDAYAVEAIKSVAAGQNDFPLCGVVCEVAEVHSQGLLVTEMKCLESRPSEQRGATPITFENDFENDLILIYSVVDGRRQVNRLRVLDAWVLLYCLDPERFDEGGAMMTFCEHVLLHEPPIGFALDDEMAYSFLPDGSQICIPSQCLKTVANALESKLTKYTEGLGIEFLA